MIALGAKYSRGAADILYEGTRRVIVDSVATGNAITGNIKTVSEYPMGSAKIVYWEVADMVSFFAIVGNV